MAIDLDQINSGLEVNTQILLIMIELELVSLKRLCQILLGFHY